MRNVTKYCKKQKKNTNQWLHNYYYRIYIYKYNVQLINMSQRFDLFANNLFVFFSFIFVWVLTITNRACNI